MGAIAVPVLPGKVDAWRQWLAECQGARKTELEDMNSRFGLTRHRAWLQQNPDGSYVVIAVHDGPCGDEFMGKLGASDNEFDTWFRQHIQEVHGIDFSQPMPPLPELGLDSQGAAHTD